MTTFLAIYGALLSTLAVVRQFWDRHVLAKQRSKCRQRPRMIR